MTYVEGELVTPSPKRMRELLLPARRAVQPPRKATPPKKFAMDGRSKLTDEVTEYVCDRLGEGAPIVVIAAAVGIGERTFHEWMAKGREARSGKYRDFYEAVEIAKARYELHHVRELNRVAVEGETEIHETVRVNHKGEMSIEIKKVTKRNGKASAALLAARHPERWGDRHQIEQKVTVEDNRVDAVRFEVVPAATAALTEDEAQLAASDEAGD